MNAATSVEATVASAASKGMGGGTVTSVYGWITSNEMIALVGLTITILGFIVNCIFQYRRDRREQELQRAKLAMLHEQSK